MSAMTLSVLALVVSAVGNLAQFGVLMLHCRRDKREFDKRPVVDISR